MSGSAEWVPLQRASTDRGDVVDIERRVRAPRRSEAATVPTHTGLVTELVGRLLPGLDGSLWSALAVPAPTHVRLVAPPSAVHAAAAVAGVLRHACRVPTDVATAIDDEDWLSARTHLTLQLVVGQAPAPTSSVPGPVLYLHEDGRVTTHEGAIVWPGVATVEPRSAVDRFLAHVLTGSALAVALAARRNASRTDHWNAVRAFAEVPGRLDEAHRVAASRSLALADELFDAPAVLFVSQAEGLAHAANGALHLQARAGNWTQVRSAADLTPCVTGLIRHRTPVVVVEAGHGATLDAAVAELAGYGVRVIRIGRAPSSEFPVLSPHAPPWGPVEAIVPVQHLTQQVEHLARPAEVLLHGRQ